jgi:predicted nucleotidyltransferase
MLTNAQVADLSQLHVIAAEFNAELAIIGAVALLCFVDLGSFTQDVDLVVALDLADFATFTSALKEREWTRERRREHRWRGPGGSMIDLVPAGPNLRAAKQIVWPESQAIMSLTGFDHIFTRSIPFRFAAGIEFQVAPPPVVALLKIVAFTEDPHRRQKDLLHLASLFRNYERSSDRIFGDDVFDAGLEDIEYANAFLLGSDMGTIASSDDADIVNLFLNRQRISEPEFHRAGPRRLTPAGAATVSPATACIRAGIPSRSQARIRMTRR